MVLKSGLLLSAWLSLVAAIPIPQHETSGTGGEGTPLDGTSPSNGMQPTTAGLQGTRTLTQTMRRSRLQTGGNMNPSNLLGEDEYQPEIDTSLINMLGSPNNRALPDQQRRSRDSAGKLAPPGTFAYPHGWPNTDWGLNYRERYPDDMMSVTSMGKKPSKMLDTNRSNKEQNSPDTDWTGTQQPVKSQGLHKTEIQSVFSRKQTPRATYTPPTSSRRESNTQTPQQQHTEEVFVKSYREQYPEYADTISFLEDGDPHISAPSKQFIEHFKFHNVDMKSTSRIQIPPLMAFGKGPSGEGPGDVLRRDSDLLPSDLENVLWQFVESTDDAGVDKESCNISDFDCVNNNQGRKLPMAGEIKNGHEMFQVRNPGKTLKSVQYLVNIGPVKPLGFTGGPRGATDEHYF
ncbi:hypothetical protein TWF694_009882 [Orbilia ellipsospora]|uniref:Uncharacterized protein n=1 Tax=Orbilia ellipsospora TaxID=2528407 RepID=A0AAV9XC62_9PEZI